MKENHLWKTSLQEINMGLWVQLSQNRNSMTWKHPHSLTTKKVQNWTIWKRTNGNTFLKLWRPPDVCEFLLPKTSTATNTVKLEQLFKAIKWMRSGQLTGGIRFLCDGTWLHTSPTERPSCERGNGKFCSIRCIVLIYHQISISSSNLRTFHKEKDLGTRTHCKKLSCNTSHPLEGNTAAMERFNL